MNTNTYTVELRQFSDEYLADLNESSEVYGVGVEGQEDYDLTTNVVVMPNFVATPTLQMPLTVLSAGQTHWNVFFPMAFTLLLVNGTTYYEGEHYSIQQIGLNLTLVWNGAFDLEPDDSLLLLYEL